TSPPPLPPPPVRLTARGARAGAPPSHSREPTRSRRALGVAGDSARAGRTWSSSAVPHQRRNLLQDAEGDLLFREQRQLLSAARPVEQGYPVSLHLEACPLLPRIIDHQEIEVLRLELPAAVLDG